MSHQKKLNRHIPKRDKKKWKLKLFIFLFFLLGVLAALDPRILPPVVRNQQVTREFYRLRDQLALKLPPILRPASVVSVDTLTKPATPGQGYAPVERRKMEDLMDKGTQ